MLQNAGAGSQLSSSPGACPLRQCPSVSIAKPNGKRPMYTHLLGGHTIWALAFFFDCVTRPRQPPLSTEIEGLSMSSSSHWEFTNGGFGITTYLLWREVW